MRDYEQGFEEIAILSKSESEEKEEPKGNMTVEQYEQQLEEKFAHELIESQERSCGGEQYCDCAKGAFERKANRDVVDGYEACCPFRKREPIVDAPVKVSDTIKSAFDIETFLFNTYEVFENLPYIKQHNVRLAMIKMRVAYEEEIGLLKQEIDYLKKSKDHPF
jgi:hypothetical protein